MMGAVLLGASLAMAGALDGVWRQDCARGYQREEVFAGEQGTFTERNFSDLGCHSVKVETISRGLITLGADLPDGTREIDFVFSSVHIKPRNEETAAHYRRRRICGYRDWAADEEREVTGRDCDFFGLGSVIRVPGAGVKKFGIVKITPNELYFGDLSPERDGSSPSKRPSTLDLRPYRAIP